MFHIQRVLCPVDFSSFSGLAYDYAESLARHYHAELVVQHVIQPTMTVFTEIAPPDAVVTFYRDIKENASLRLEQFVKSHQRNGTRPEILVQEGLVTDTILSCAQSSAADLIVMGTHGRRGFDRLALGSVTESVLRKAQCPVLVIRKPEHDFVVPASVLDPVQLKRILFCSDFSEAAQGALSYAISLATEYGASLTLLHVLTDIPSSEEFPNTISDAVDRLESLVPAEAREWCNIKTAVRVGRPYQEIILYAYETRTDLIVMGVRGRNALDMAVFGSTTHRVIQLGSTAVLAVHA